MIKYIKNLIVAGVIFSICGEILIRIDEEFQLFRDTAQTQIAVKTAESRELALLKSGYSFADHSALKILVIGDSYVYGGGVPASDKMSHQLKLKMQEMPIGSTEFFVLDVSKPANNSRKNALNYFSYVEAFNPDYVVIGYNINDIEGWMGPEKERNFDYLRTSGLLTMESDEKTQTPNSELVTPNDDRQHKKSTIEIVYSILYKSRLLQSVLHRTHKELNRQGVVISFSQFGKLLNSYRQQDKKARDSNEWLNLIANHSAKNGSQVVIYFFPEMNLLENPSLFTNAYEQVATNFASQENVALINGINKFGGAPSSDYRLSLYDGHPNSDAHEVIADHIYQEIKRLEQASNR